MTNKPNKLKWDYLNIKLGRLQSWQQKAVLEYVEEEMRSQQRIRLSAYARIVLAFCAGFIFCLLVCLAFIDSIDSFFPQPAVTVDATESWAGDVVYPPTPIRERTVCYQTFVHGAPSTSSTIFYALERGEQVIVREWWKNWAMISPARWVDGDALSVNGCKD